MPHLSGRSLQYASDYVHLPADADIFPAHRYALKIDLERGQLTTYWQADPVTEAYVAYLGRPGDPAGVAYWSQFADTPSVIFESFSQSDEYQSLVADKTNFQIVERLYHYLFNRAPDEGGHAYWTAQLDAGNLSINDLVPALMYGATGSDSDTVAAKIWAAQDFTLALDTELEIQAYEHATVEQGEQVKAWLAGIGSPDGYDLPGHDLVAAGIQPLIDQVLL
ncbi:MAG: DUF4214 domain-containing protein [Azonexus sp.]|jgi:hypothetical protein|uniref:DUF4214 domain-containing protein n=1 Tax=Azonexus sp. TaxID=1872668 RepID=UPI002819F41C|nr:DUF4214 domain-containing protein [Azonexus sp.]MDR0775408.1 DUF4214 domain-containing protein [Azonexus sp.]